MPYNNAEFDTTPILVENTHKLLQIHINGLPLRSQDLLDIQINYEDIIRGRVAFVDTLNISEFAPLTYSAISIEIIDIFDNRSKVDAIITDVKVLRLKTNQINVTIKFEDVNSNLLGNSYISKSYKDMSMLQIIEDLFKELQIGANVFHAEDDYVYESFVVPSNISILDFIKTQIRYNNIVMFSDRDGINFVSKDLLNYSLLEKPSEYAFTLNRNNKYPHWNILEYDGNVSRTKHTMRAVNSNLSNVDVKDLQYKPYNLKIEDVYNTQKVNGYMGFNDVKFHEIFGGVGKREISHICHNETLGEDEDYRDIINNHQRIEIVVQGLNVLRMYSKIKVDLPRAQSVQTQKNDETFSATYVVVGVTDKLLGGNLFQFLTLNASDYGRGSGDIV